MCKLRRGTGGGGVVNRAPTTRYRLANGHIEGHVFFHPHSSRVCVPARDLDLYSNFFLAEHFSTPQCLVNLSFPIFPPDNHIKTYHPDKAIQ
jgi:hypothetical protein